MTRNLKYSATFWLFMPFIFSSCRTDKVNSDIDRALVQADGQADNVFTEIDGITETSLSFYSIGTRKEGSEDSLIICAQKTIDPDTRTITLDFGDGCQGFAGRVRKGKVFIHYSYGFFIPGASVITTFQNFYINDIKVEGTRILTNITTPADTLVKFHAVVSNGKLTWPDSTSSTRESDLIQTWIRGDTPWKDEITVDGVANGTTRNGNKYVMNISSPLLFKRACWIFKSFVPVAGMKQLESNGNTMVVNYGDGSCDRIATVSLNGISKTLDVTKGN